MQEGSSFTLFTGNRIDNGTACFVTSGATETNCNIRSCQALFCTAPSGFSKAEGQRPPVSAKVVGVSRRNETFAGENRRDGARLVIPDLHRHDPARLEMTRGTRRDLAIGDKAIRPAIER